MIVALHRAGIPGTVQNQHIRPRVFRPSHFREPIGDFVALETIDESFEQPIPTQILNARILHIAGRGGIPVRLPWCIATRSQVSAQAKQFIHDDRQEVRSVYWRSAL